MQLLSQSDPLDPVLSGTGGGGGDRPAGVSGQQFRET